MINFTYTRAPIEGRYICRNLLFSECNELCQTSIQYKITVSRSSVADTLTISAVLASATDRESVRACWMCSILFNSQMETGQKLWLLNALWSSTEEILQVQTRLSVDESWSELVSLAKFGVRSTPILTTAAAAVAAAAAVVVVSRPPRLPTS
jgi:hypothetical protein